MCIVLVSEFERNLYDGSDGFAIIYNRKTQRLSKVHIWSTRCSMPTNILYHVNVTRKHLTFADQFGIKKEMVRVAYRSGLLYEGDTVEVVAGRKVPHGLIFRIEKISEFKDHFGRVQNTYAIGKDKNGNSIKTSLSNCKLKKPTRYDRKLYLWDPQINFL